HGCHRLRACPGEPYAYHRLFHWDSPRDRVCAARGGAYDGSGRLDCPASDLSRACAGAHAGIVRERVMASATHDLNELKRRMQGAIQLLKQELGGLRTGRASAHLLDPIQVEAYGSHMPLNQLATVSVPEPRMITVQVWDRSMVHPVEKAIINSN